MGGWGRKVLDGGGEGPSNAFIFSFSFCFYKQWLHWHDRKTAKCEHNSTDLERSWGNIMVQSDSLIRTHGDYGSANCSVRERRAE